MSFHLKQFVHRYFERLAFTLIGLALLSTLTSCASRCKGCGDNYCDPVCTTSVIPKRLSYDSTAEDFALAAAGVWEATFEGTETAPEFVIRVSVDTRAVAAGSYGDLVRWEDSACEAADRVEAALREAERECGKINIQPRVSVEIAARGARTTAEFFELSVKGVSLPREAFETTGKNRATLSSAAIFSGLVWIGRVALNVEGTDYAFNPMLDLAARSIWIEVQEDNTQNYPVEFQKLATAVAQID